LQKAKVSAGQFVKPGEYPAIVLDLADETLYHVPFSVYVPIVIPGLFAVGPGGDYSHHAALRQILDETLCVIPFVGDHGPGLDTGQQG